jgi:hypothetical protein
MEAFLLWKALAFLSSKISQVTSKVSEPIAVWSEEGSPVLRCHQSSITLVGQSLSSTKKALSHTLMRLHSLIVNRQCENKCAADSMVCLHKGQAPQFGHPLFSNISVVQSLFCKASHANDLFFRGAQIFHTTTDE